MAGERGGGGKDLFLDAENKIHIFTPPSNIPYIFLVMKL